MVVFGGNDGDRCYNDLFILELRAGATESDALEWEWIRPVTVGTAPCPRTGHGAALLDDGVTLLVHGGWDPSGGENDDDEVRYFSDAFTLNTKTWEWRRAVLSPDMGDTHKHVGSAHASPGASSAPCALTGHTLVATEPRQQGNSGGSGGGGDDSGSIPLAVAVFGGQTSSGDRRSQLDFYRVNTQAQVH